MAQTRRTQQADLRAVKIAPALAEAWKAGAQTDHAIAAVLNVHGFRTARGCLWTANGVHRVLLRLRRLEMTPAGESLRDVPPASPVQRAVDAHREKFGFAPGTWRLEGDGRDRQLAMAIHRAVRKGVPFDYDATARAFGVGVTPFPAVG